MYILSTEHVSLYIYYQKNNDKTVTCFLWEVYFLWD